MRNDKTFAFSNGVNTGSKWVIVSFTFRYHGLNSSSMKLLKPQSVPGGALNL